jgi:prephenate dehydratase
VKIKKHLFYTKKEFLHVRGSFFILVQSEQMNTTNFDLPKQNGPRVVIQGVPGAFHAVAARQFFGLNTTLVPAATFEELVQLACLPTHADAAVMAIENSIAGSILPNYSLLQRSQLRIVGEVLLPIRQNLLALPGVTLQDLASVHSHPMALAQCKLFLKQFPTLQLVESEDTAMSAAEIAKNGLRNRAAIASTLAAELYGLAILVPGIEDDPVNFTRFLVLKPATDIQPLSGANKVSLQFGIPHQSGSLSRILTMLAAEGANLTKIQSAPKLGKAWEYQFFIDFIHPNPAHIPATLQLLDATTQQLQVLGVYEAGKMPETHHLNTKNTLNTTR